MRMKSFLFACLLIFCVNVNAEKVQSIFWGEPFGAMSESFEKCLKNAEFEPIVDGDNIFIQNAELSGVKFKLVQFAFSPVDAGLYRVVGSNRFESKEAADSCYNAALARAREIYPNSQIQRHPENAEKMCVYPDGENVFSLALISTKKDGKKIYFVRVSYWNDLKLKAIQEARR